ncbi:putative 2-dehydropantoate 2-reductase [compost metagenome]
MKFDIIGAGAIGLLFGGSLAASGEDVVLWTRSEEQAAQLAAEGIELEDDHGNSIIIRPDKFKVYSVDCVADTSVRKPDYLLIMTKQWHVDERLLRTIGVLCGEGTSIVCFQNGVGHVDAFLAAAGGNPLYVAITTEGARRKNTRSVIRSKPGSTIIGVPGKTDQDIFDDPSAENLMNKLLLAGFQALLSKDIDKEINRKLLINAVINPLTALWRVPNGELIATPERREVLRHLCSEAVEIFQACGMDIDDNIYDYVVSVCESTSHNISSMLKDVLQGSPTEIESINGQLIKMAHQAGISAPGHEVVTKLIKGLLRR